MIQPVTRTQPLTRIDRDKPCKITSLPINKPKVKQNDWGRPLDYIIILAIIAGIAILNGLIGG